MRKSRRNKLIGIVVLVIILGVSFGICQLFFVPPVPVRSLEIKDLEKAHITTTRCFIERGWVYVFRDYSGRVFFNEEGNGQYDNQNIFHNGVNIENALALCIEIYPDGTNQTVIRAGDTIEIAYDGNQELVVYLPEINITQSDAGQIYLYIASDGSTYYDKELTRLAQKSIISSRGRK